MTFGLIRQGIELTIYHTRMKTLTIIKVVVNEYVSYENDDNNINVSEDRENITGRSEQQCITLRLE